MRPVVILSSTFAILDTSRREAEVVQQGVP